MTLYYYERPPFSATAPDGTVQGLVIAPTRAALERIGMAYVFQSTSVNRIFELVRDEHGTACSPGWYWTEERARFAKFTKAIYRDKPIIGITRKTLHVPVGTRLADLLAAGTTLTVTHGFSYGQYIDGLIAHADPNQLIPIPTGGPRMIDMVLTGHTDLALTSEEDASAYASQGIGGPDYPIVHFPDVPMGESRRIMCARGVPDDVIERLNQAIDGP